MTSTRVKTDLADEIKQRIIDVILASPLNIQAIDDVTERELYTTILDVVEEYVVHPSFLQYLASACCPKPKID